MTLKATFQAECDGCLDTSKREPTSAEVYADLTKGSWESRPLPPGDGTLDLCPTCADIYNNIMRVRG